MPEIKGWKKGIILVPFSEEGVIFFPYNTMPEPMHDTMRGIIKCCVHYEFFFYLQDRAKMAKLSAV